MRRTPSPPASSAACRSPAGVGTIQGVVIGAIILQAINFSLNFLGVNAYLQYIVRGLIIVLAVASTCASTW